MSFTENDRHSALWIALKRNIRKEINEQRDHLEVVRDTGLVALAQGQILAYRKIIEMVEPTTDEAEDLREPSNSEPLYS